MSGEPRPARRVRRRAQRPSDGPPAGASPGEAGPSADERDLGWGELPPDEDADRERFLADRPPHHEPRADS